MALSMQQKSLSFEICERMDNWTYMVDQKSRLLILSEHVNKNEKIGGT